MLRPSVWSWVSGLQGLIVVGLSGVGLLAAYSVDAEGRVASQVRWDDGAPGLQGTQSQEAQSQEAQSQAEVDATVEDPERKELIEKFEKYLSGAKLKGRFTILGRDLPPEDEEYTIISAKKLPERDLWLLEARIKYGKWDETVPLTLPIKWADKTPVITIEKLIIPGMGTFSARVLFNNGMYSGTWAHDDVKGQLFGQVLPSAGLPDSEESGESRASESTPIK